MARHPWWAAACLALVQAAAAGAPADSAKTDCYGDPLPDGALVRMGTVRCRHAGDVCFVGFLADGKTILSVGKDDAVRCWDAASGKQVRRWAAPSFRGCAALSPDRTLLAAAAGDDVVLWNAESGDEVRRLPHGDHWTSGLAFSPEGRILATCGTRIRLWDVSTGQRLREWDGAREHESVDYITFLSDGKRLVSTGVAGGIRWWDAATGKVIRDVPGRDAAGYMLAAAPTGQWLATCGNDEAVWLWDSDAEKPTVRFPTSARENRVYSIAFTADGKTLAVGFLNGVIRLIRAETQEELRHWQAHQDAVTALAFSPDGATLISGGGDGAVRQWRAADGEQQHAFAGWHGRVHALAVSPDGAAVASAGIDRRAHLWEAATGRERRSFESAADEPAVALRFSPDGRALTTLSGPGNAAVKVWDTLDGRLLHEWTPGDAGYASGAVLAPDGAAVAAGGPPDRMALLDPATGQLLHEYAEEGPRRPLQPGVFLDPRTVAAVYSSRGSSTSADGILVWHADTGARELKPLPPKLGYVARLAAPPDGKLLAILGGNSRVVLWNAASAEVIREFDAGKDFILAAEFSPDGRTLAVTDLDGAISLWEVATGRRRGLLRGDQGFIDALAFSPDGRRLYSGGHDGTVLAWDLTGRARQTAPAAPGAETLRRLWDDLSGADGARAYAAVWALAAAPEQSVPFLKGRLQRPAPTAARIARCIADFDSDDFATRERAAEELRWADDAAEDALKAALAAQPSPEARRRIEETLAWIAEGRRGVHPPDWRIVRAIEALEQAGTPEAGDVLAGLADGPETSVSREARESLERLRRRGQSGERGASAP